MDTNKIKNLENQCKAGKSESCYDLAYMYEYDLKNGINNSKALEYYREACNLGDKNGCADYENLKKEIIQKSKKKNK